MSCTTFSHQHVCMLSCFKSTGTQVVDNWYPGTAKDSKGVVLVVTAGKEGAISGGDKFLGVSVHSGRTETSTAQHRSCHGSVFMFSSCRQLRRDSLLPG